MNRILLLGTAGAIALVVGGKMALNQHSPSNSALAYGESSSSPVQAITLLQPGTTRASSSSPAPISPVPEQQHITVNGSQPVLGVNLTPTSGSIRRLTQLQFWG
jgi:hypothetical protein